MAEQPPKVATLDPLRRISIAVASGVITAPLVAVFMWLLDRATVFRVTHSAWLVAAPVLAVLVLEAPMRRLRYPLGELGTQLRLGSMRPSVDADGTLPTVPLRAGAFVLISTPIAHLLGASVGREGAAAQIGAVFTQALARAFDVGGGARFDGSQLRRAAGRQEAQRIALLTGVAAGFAAVFGTPLAGAVFALEWQRQSPAQAAPASPRVALVNVRALLSDMLPAMVAGYMGHRIAGYCGLRHVGVPQYSITTVLASMRLYWGLDWFLIAVALGALAWVYLLGKERVQLFCKVRFAGASVSWLKLPAALLVLLLASHALRTRAYLGLGGAEIADLLHPRSAAPTFAFLWKGACTAMSVGAGFPGGEVTPLFFMGASCSRTIAVLTGSDTSLAAAVGMLSLFGIAGRVPLAAACAALELFGAPVAPVVLVVAMIGMTFTRRKSLYSIVPKASAHDAEAAAGVAG
jgi:H+/Cl- antiporter ClcA